MSWAIAALAIIGAWLNANKRIEGFWCWLVSNAWLAGHNFRIGEHAQGILWLVYCGICVYGLVNWARRRKPDEQYD